MIGGLSASGSATVVSLRLRSRRLSASASLSRSPNRWPKPLRVSPIFCHLIYRLANFPHVAGIYSHSVGHSK